MRDRVPQREKHRRRPGNIPLILIPEKFPGREALSLIIPHFFFQQPVSRITEERIHFYAEKWKGPIRHIETHRIAPAFFTHHAEVLQISAQGQWGAGGFLLTIYF